MTNMEKEIALAGIWLFAAATALAPKVTGEFMVVSFGAALIVTWHLV